jgi:hypothetical protein
MASGLGIKNSAIGRVTARKKRRIAELQQEKKEELQRIESLT